jgi:hypothetical protein
LNYFPIVQNNHDTSLLGAVTDRDLAVKVLAKDRVPKKTLARDMMVTDVVMSQIRLEKRSLLD